MLWGPGLLGALLPIAWRIWGMYDARKQCELANAGTQLQTPPLGPNA